MINMVILIAIIMLIDRRRQMKRRLSAVEARKRLGEVLEGVFYRGDEVVIERAGKPMAVVIPAALYEDMQRRKKEAGERLWALMRETQERNKNVPPEVIEAEVDEAVREVRSEMRREEQKSKKAKKGG
ncbi:MAG: type II toxin-antitoxin system prevent-host-death family antitoxin [Dehalococcoidia bacterium]|nr:type II toxin-antitoxin system prevent-host-death family antitoxin [Dehalococcoidia bacterium]